MFLQLLHLVTSILIHTRIWVYKSSEMIMLILLIIIIPNYDKCIALLL